MYGEELHKDLFWVWFCSDLINNMDDRREWAHQEDADLEDALSTLEDRLSIQNYLGKWGK